jgi:hypothetical protein
LLALDRVRRITRLELIRLADFGVTSFWRALLAEIDPETARLLGKMLG